jgi:hypothetical protein
VGVGTAVRSFFVEGGSALDADVPLGTFIIKYATGKTWCGDRELFGPDTVTSRADETFTFEHRATGDGYTTTHWTVELVLQRHGNLRTSRIAREMF